MNIINEKVVEYLDGQYKTLRPELFVIRKYAEQNHIPIILKDTETLIISLLKVKKPKRILEIGTAIGYSASCFAEVCKTTEIVTIESNMESKNIAVKNIDMLGYKNQITVLFGNATDVLKDMEISEKFDFIFIDAGKSHYKDFFDEALKHCEQEALIISDNVLLNAKTVSDEYDPRSKYKTNIKKMREFLEYITNLENIYTAVIPVGDGLAVSVLGDMND
ncbi:MAG: O-methyltransferase [Peptostreptococcaceae bacterium]|nr:O-methyltransferase [Peptostreptococcaceae bacterium]